MDFIAHEPERRPRTATVLTPGCCCCCCCCCVHSVGSLGGAIYGSLRRDAPLPETLTSQDLIRRESEISRAHRYAVKVYWLSLTIIGTLTIAVCMALNPTEPLVGPVVVAFFLPVGQLAASLVSAIYIKARPSVRQDLSLRRIGRITVFSLLGGVIGILGTVLTFSMM